MLMASQPLPPDIDVVEAAQTTLFEIRLILHLLESSIDRDFDPARAVASNNDMLTFFFSRDRIEATTWLIDEAWTRTAGLQEKLLAHVNMRQAERESRT